MIEIFASIFTCWFLLYSIWRLCFKVQLQKVKGGIKNDIALPYSEPIEFYFADVSSMSMKVRFCLALAGCEFKSYLMQLPSAGSFETKSKEYLEVNPAGTVPVLVHNGYPIHESSEQVLYIADNLSGHKLIPDILDGNLSGHKLIPDILDGNLSGHKLIPDILDGNLSGHKLIPDILDDNLSGHKLIPDILDDNLSGRKLIPDILDGKWACEYWLRETSIDGEEISSDIEQAMKSRLGNCIPMLSLPMFAVIAPTISWKCIFKGIFIRGLHPMQIVTIIFKILGVKTFYYMPKFVKIVKKAKEQLLLRLVELEERLSEKDSTFIAGNEVTVADIGWAPIVERLDLARWWEHIDSDEFSNVKKYWRNMRELPAYKEAVRPIDLEKDFLSNIRSQINKWKREYSWFRSMYEHLP